MITGLSEGLDHLQSRGVGLNVASFIGGHNLRVLAGGFEDRPLEPAELDRLRAVVGEEMQEGALGIGTALASSIPPSYHVGGMLLPGVAHPRQTRTPPPAGRLRRQEIRWTTPTCRTS